MNKKITLITKIILIFVIGLLVYALDGIRMTTAYTHFFGILVHRTVIFDTTMIIIFALLIALIIIIIMDSVILKWVMI